MPKTTARRRWRTHTLSLDFVLALGCVVALAIRRFGSLPWRGAQKNVLWDLRDDASQLLRPCTPPGARSVERTVSYLSRSGSAPGSLPPMCRGETRAAGVSGRQSLLHQALRVLRGPALPLGDDQGHRRGTAPGLGGGQGVGQAVHARASEARRHTGPESHRYRRDLDPQRPHLPHCRQRSRSVIARSGSVARIAARPAWTSSIGLSGKRRPETSVWR